MIEEAIKEFILENSEGTTVGICNFGAAVTKFCIAHTNGQLTDVVLGFKNLNDYQNNPCFLGVTVGRYANRIANGVFNLENKEYKLDINNAPNCLHGGYNGFQNKLWEVKNKTQNSVTLSCVSAHLEGGFAGNLTVYLKFELTNENELVINYNAQTDETTVINLTNHAYFNLNGHNTGVCTQHLLKINAQHFTPTNSVAIPTGELKSVKNTPFDFEDFKPIQQNINDDNEQIIFGAGYDHNFVLADFDGNLQLAAEVIGNQTNIKLQVFTTEPGLQFYTGNHLNDASLGKSGTPYGYRAGFCLETQHFPNSPNQANFPTTVLNANKQFKSTTIYKVSI